jgi:small GTP-binding protein
MEVVSEKTVLLNVWDTAGQERYHKMMPLFFRGAACLLLVIDASSPSSWEFAKKMAETDLVTLDPKPLVFVAVNKIDLGVTVEEQAIREWAQKSGFGFYRTSALTGDGVIDVFKAMADRLVEGAVANKQRPKVKLQDAQLIADSRKCC